MPPDLLFDSYKHYKGGTMKLTTWLVETAQQCAGSFDLLPTYLTVTQMPSAAKARTDSRKTGKELFASTPQESPSKFTVPLRDLAPLAKIIVQSEK